MKHRIIKDEVILKNFIDWLPDLQPTEKFYVALFARKKYDDTLQSTASDKMQLKRLLCTKESMIQKIRQLEIEEGLYRLKDRVATQKSLAIYITPNPRCMIKANKDMLIRLATAVSNQNFFHNLHAESLSCVQRAKSYAYVVDFDIDDKTVDLSLMNDIMPRECYEVLETKNGYHILVFPPIAAEHSYYKNWHTVIQRVFPCDITGDQLIPIPGCTQGEFTPKFIK